MTDEDRDRVLLEVRDLLQRLTTAAAQRAGTPRRPVAAAVGGVTASDATLDGPHGDPVVKRDPPEWSGDSNAGQPFSACPSDFLLTLANHLDRRADRNAAEGQAKYARYDRLDASRARGWARRNAEDRR